LFGTPFDLDEMINIQGLDVMHITHIRVVDVVGSVDEMFATYDSQGHKVNDPWPTPFPSSGFDLDAVGVIHQSTTSIQEQSNFSNIQVFPNPLHHSGYLKYSLNKSSTVDLKIYSADGSMVFGEKSFQSEGVQTLSLNEMKLKKGVYIVVLSDDTSVSTYKFIVNE
ncbi:MAG: cell surface protein, partial [Bacteroidetes bacterium OLB10]